MLAFIAFLVRRAGLEPALVPYFSAAAYSTIRTLSPPAGGGLPIPHLLM